MNTKEKYAKIWSDWMEGIDIIEYQYWGEIAFLGHVGKVSEKKGLDISVDEMIFISDVLYWHSRKRESIYQGTIDYVNAYEPA